MSHEIQSPQRYICLADDDADDRDFFSAALQQTDPSVILKQAENGMQLMEILRNIKDQVPEILFLDINMPGKSGFECLEEIRKQQGRLKEIKIIILSSRDDAQYIEKARELGANFYAVKPNEFDVLKSLVKEVLQIDWDRTGEIEKFRLI